MFTRKYEIDLDNYKIVWEAKMNVANEPYLQANLPFNQVATVIKKGKKIEWSLELKGTVGEAKSGFVFSMLRAEMIIKDKLEDYIDHNMFKM